MILLEVKDLRLFDIESEIEIKNTQFMHPDPGNQEKRPLQNHEFNPFVGLRKTVVVFRESLRGSGSP